MNSELKAGDSSKIRNAGFTLLEVLISMAILVFISFAIYQATIQTFRLRDSLTTEGNFYNGIRLATTIVQRDINLLYSPVIGLPSPSPVPAPPGGIPGGIVPAAPMPEDLGLSYNFWSAAVNVTGLRPSRLIGTETKLSFISLSHFRIYKDSPESEFAKITYELKKEEKPTENRELSVLFKTESPNAFARDDLRDQYVRSYDILHGVKKLSFSYLQRDGNTWKTFKSWDTDKEENKNRFPDVIEMSLEVIGPNRQFFEGKFKFRPEIPTNGINPKI
jgi:prepilin-type N-terminal cleavage/methylation domain-containing protein